MAEFSGNDIKKGYFWSFVSKFGVVAILFINNIVLSRLLTPEDFGAIAIVNIFIAISSILVESGFGSALIQRKAPTNTDYSSVFFFNIILSVSLYALLYFSVTWIADFVKINEITTLLRALGVVLIINSLFTIQRNRLQKQMNFKKISIVEISAALVGCTTGIIFAYNGYGVWSLIYYQITSSVLSCLLFWGISGWKPSWVFSSKSLKSLFKFGSGMLASSIIESIYTHTSSFIIGNRFSAASLGVFSQAHKLSDVPVNSLNTVVGSVSYPLFSSLQDEPSKVVQIFRRNFVLVAFFVFGVMTLFFTVAQSLILFLFTEKWVDSIPFFQIFCVSSPFLILNTMQTTIIKSMGRSRLFFVTQTAKRVLGLCLMLIAANFGLYIFAITVAFNIVIFNIINVLILKFIVHYGYKKYLRDITPPILLSLLCGVPALLLSNLLTLPPILNLIVISVLFFILYIGLGLIFKFEGSIFILNLLKKIIQKFKH